MDNVSNPVAKGLTREGVEVSSTRMRLWPIKTHRCGKSTLNTGDSKI